MDTSPSRSVCLFPESSDTGTNNMDVQLLTLAVEELISINRKRKVLWKSHFDAPEITATTLDKPPDAKKKPLASNEKLDQLLTELSNCQLEFWSHLDKFKHVLLTELRPQAIELGKQLDEIRARRSKHDLDPGQKNSLRKAESDVRSQIETLYDHMVDVVTGKTNHDDAVTHQLFSQRNTIMD